MKFRLFTTLSASGLFLAASLAMAQNAQPDVKPPVAKQPVVRSKTPIGRAEKAKTKGATNMLDLNRASKDELKKLPGVTDALADKIIAGRPYLTKARLVTQNVVSMGVYQGIKDKVVAGYVAPAKKP